MTPVVASRVSCLIVTMVPGWMPSPVTWTF